MDRVNLSQKFSLFTSHWDPKIVGDVNGHQVKLVKFQGPFVWHRHENEDEPFLVYKGRFAMEFRDRSVPVEEGEFIIVPQHRRLERGRDRGARITEVLDARHGSSECRWTPRSAEI